MDGIPELGNPALQPVDDPIFLAFIKCGGTAFRIDLAGLKQRVDDHEDLMRQRHNRFLLPPPRRQAAEECGQKGVALLDRRPSRLKERRRSPTLFSTNRSPLKSPSTRRR